MEKVKINREQKGIVKLMEEYYNGNKEEMVIGFMEHKKRNGFKLEDIGLDEFIRMVYVGYEIEKTPEELILEKYKEFNNEKITDLELGFMNGIKFALDSYGYKIKGVND